MGVGSYPSYSTFSAAPCLWPEDSGGWTKALGAHTCGENPEEAPAPDQLSSRAVEVILGINQLTEDLCFPFYLCICLSNKNTLILKNKEIKVSFKNAECLA